MGETTRRAKAVIGWREWVALPDFGVPSLKAKVDTGARTSSLHAFDLEEFKIGRRSMVRFSLHPEQRSAWHSVEVEVPLFDRRKVKASSGHSELRPIVLATVELHGQRWEVEMTLTFRDEMGFRMLLGRQAIRGRFLVDPGRSYTSGRRIKGSRNLKPRPRRDAR